MAGKKGYWIAHVSILKPEPYGRYAALAPQAFEKYGARILARGGEYSEMEGAMRRTRHVVIEFPSYQSAVDCYNSIEYQRARDHRDGAGDAYIVLVEGA